MVYYDSEEDLEDVKPPSSKFYRSQAWSALTLGPRRRMSGPPDSLTHRGRHFGRTVFSMCNIQSLIVQGLTRSHEQAEDPDDVFTAEENQEYLIYQTLLQMIPGLEDRLVDGGQDEIYYCSRLIQSGLDSARSDDTRGLRDKVIDWITPRDKNINPPLNRYDKSKRGFNHEVTGRLLCPTELDWDDPEIKKQLQSGKSLPSDSWPLLLYADLQYNPDEPWEGLFCNEILVKAFKHVFTTPSSVNGTYRGSRGNARIHGMQRVTPASIAYIAMQVRFAFSSAITFSRSDLVTDSEGFYRSVMELFNDEDEQEEVKELLGWWNERIFAIRPPSTNSALAKIRQNRALKKKAAAARAPAAVGSALALAAVTVE